LGDRTKRKKTLEGDKEAIQIADPPGWHQFYERATRLEKATHAVKESFFFVSLVGRNVTKKLYLKLKIEIKKGKSMRGLGIRITRGKFKPPLARQPPNPAEAGGLQCKKEGETQKKNKSPLNGERA